MIPGRFASIFTLAVLALSTAPVSACTACFGQSDSELARGMNFGILTLLLVVVSVLGGFAAFAVFLARREAQFPVPGPDGTSALSKNTTKA
jgi:hypothetical protein